MIRKTSSKKANVILDGALILIMVVVFAGVGLLCYKILFEVNNQLQVEPLVTAEARQVVQTSTINYPKIIDSIVMFMMVMLTIGLIVSVYLLDTRPVFLIITFILMMFVLVSTVFISNYYESLASQPELAPLANNLVYTSFIASHLLQIMIGIMMIGSIILYARLK